MALKLCFRHMRWYFLFSEPADGVDNMALDEALARRAARTGDAVFRVYAWSHPTLSLGRNQRARGCYDEEAAGRLGVSFVRRPTGGRALLHDHEITYSATLPCDGAAGARSAYALINDVLLNALGRLGVRAERAAATTALPPGPRPCFDVPAEHEIVSNGRKLIGSAQWRRGGALLQHGSILVRDDQPMIGRLSRPASNGTPAAATLAEALGREPSRKEVGESILHALGVATGGAPSFFQTDPVLEQDARTLRATYADPAWTWRR
jgi:lipoyl(octanoyl) transferase